MEDGKYKIEKGIEISSRKNKWRNLFDQMKLGDSILFDYYTDAHNLQMAARREKDFKISIRNQDGGKARAWKIRKERSDAEKV